VTKPGKVVGGQYEIQELIGRGGIGEVFAAVDLRTGGRVAVKFLREEYASDVSLVTRFSQESKIMKAIASEHVARVLDSGKNREGRLWIALELLEGESLDRRLQREVCLPFVDVASIIECLFRGLDVAHGAGVVHRDVKPANLFLVKGTAPVQAKVLDFGVSKVWRPRDDITDHALTTLGDMLGTASFMAPEQIIAAVDVDPRADLYAAGVVAFLSLAGGIPFVGTTRGAILLFKRTEVALRLAEVTRTTWPEPFEDFFAKILARESNARFASAKEALAAWCALHQAKDVPRPQDFRAALGQLRHEIPTLARRVKDAPTNEDDPTQVD
jgi:serine/threonine-protein kinase